MKQITAFTNDTIQQINLVLDDGSTAQMTMTYVPAQKSWFYTVTYGSFQSNLMRIVNSPNLLRKYRHVIPFGISVSTIDGYEIVNQNDFSSGRVSFYVLNSTDVSSMETFITQTLPTYLGEFIA